MAYVVQVNQKPKLRAALKNQEAATSSRWARRQESKRAKRLKGREALPAPK